MPANGADLPGNAAADDSHGDVESISCSSQMSGSNSEA